MIKQIIIIITGIGTGPTHPAPNTENFSGNPLIGCPLHIINAIPENAVCVANVAISAGIPIVATMKPFKRPISVDASNEISTARYILTPNSTISFAHKILTNVITDPVPRSMSPSKITNIIPTEAIPHTAT